MLKKNKRLIDNNCNLQYEHVSALKKSMKWKEISCKQLKEYV